MSDGTLSFTVWPVYIGVSLEGATPPFLVNEPHNGGYERGQINWEARDGTITGRARILCPPGTYTHFLYFKHPSRSELCGAVKMDHPIIFTEPLSVLDVDPIRNGDFASNALKGG